MKSLQVSISQFSTLNSQFQGGFLLVEILLAVSMLSLISMFIIGAVIYGQDSTRLSGNRAQAALLAEEGLEAVRNIRDDDFANLVNGTYGITTTGNQWNLSGSSDTNGIFNRQITISSVDANTKAVTSQVTWTQNQQRSGTVALATRLTYWQAVAAASVGDGIIVYDDGTTTPKYRLFNTGTFNTPSATVLGSSGRFFTMRTSPTKQEAIVGYINASGTLQIMCFDGTTWSNEWSISVGVNGNTRRFDIGYETNTGDVMVVYSRNVASANALAYRTKAGSAGCGSANWPVATNFATTPSATTGTVHWVRMARDSRSTSNILTAMWADSNSDLGVNNWSGTTWATGTGTYKALETNLEIVATSQDVDSFEVVYESLSGNAMVVWGIATGANGTNGARYSRCIGGVYTCSWTTAAIVPTVSDDIHNLDMMANPNTNQIVYAAIGNAGDDLTAAYWSGSAWTGYPNLDISTESPFAGSKLVSTAWLINGSTTRWILNYDDATGIGLSWYSATPGSAPNKEGDFATNPSIGDLRQRYDVDMGKNDQGQAVVTLTDSTRAIFAKMVSMDSSGNFTWTDADGGASLGTTSLVPPQGFTFVYWRNP